MPPARTVILAVALLFILAFAFLTVLASARDGADPILTPLSLLVLALLGFGVLGALRNPPRD
jgi:hypothetical protein